MLLAGGLGGAGLWVGRVEAFRNDPVTRTEPGARTAVPANPGHLRIMTYNIAKAFAHGGGLSFRSDPEVARQLHGLAGVIQDADPEVVILNEVLWACPGSRINQVEWLAREAGYGWWVYGEHYRVGLPGWRVSGGTAILARMPIRGLDNPDLPGRKHFWRTRNNRRALVAVLRVANRDCRVIAVHLDSFDPSNRLRQWNALQTYVNPGRTLVGGDFNAAPKSRILRDLLNPDAWSGVWNGPATYGNGTPQARCIDYLFGPADWTVLDHHVTGGTWSDHQAVMTTYRIP